MVAVVVSEELWCCWARWIMSVSVSGGGGGLGEVEGIMVAMGGL